MRAKAGKKQSSKDASGRAAHSAGASLRRHNELALKKVLKALIFFFFVTDNTITIVFTTASSFY